MALCLHDLLRLLDHQLLFLGIEEALDESGIVGYRPNEGQRQAYHNHSLQSKDQIFFYSF
jgi:hypothetical protein